MERGIYVKSFLLIVVNSHWSRVYYLPDVCEEPHICSLNSSSEQFPEAGAVVVSILQIRKLRLPEVEILIQGHTVHDWPVSTSFIVGSPWRETKIIS